MKIVKIRYIDSNILESQTDEICKPEILTAVGFELPVTGDYTTLARELIGKEYRGQISIPRPSIIHKTVLAEDNIDKES